MLVDWVVLVFEHFVNSAEDLCRIVVALTNNVARLLQSLINNRPELLGECSTHEVELSSSFVQFGSELLRFNDSECGPEAIVFYAFPEEAHGDSVTTKIRLERGESCDSKTDNPVKLAKV